MTKEWLCTDMVEDIAGLIAECDFPVDAYFLGEQQPARFVKPAERQNLLLFVPYKRDLPLAAYTSGRIFHPDFELRWQQHNGRVQVVYLGSPTYRPRLFLNSTEIDMQPPRSFYLFGTRLKPEDVREIGGSARADDFAEVRVPRLLHYPPVSKNAQRVVVWISESIDEETGRVEQYRFQDLKGEPA